MKILKYLVYILLFAAFTWPLISEARFRGGYRYYGGWHGPGPGPWHNGYWYHGGYGPRFGWWWVVGPSWYYYPAPVYPVPIYPETAPSYAVEVQGTPPPPAGAVAMPAPGSPGAPPGEAKIAEPSAGPSSVNPSAVVQPAGGSPLSPAPVVAAATTAKAKSKPQAMSYFCQKTNEYYPKAQTCADGWIASPVQGPN